MTYTWFYKNKQYCNDKLGISSDGTFMMHDDMIHKLTKFKTLARKLDNTLYLYLIYKIDDQTNWILQEYENILTFKYIGENIQNMKLNSIIFNGVEFTQIN